MPISEWMDKEEAVDTHTHTEWNITPPGEGEHPATCNNIDGSRAHYSKWDKSDIERQVLYDITYVWNLKKPNS